MKRKVKYWFIIAVGSCIFLTPKCFSQNNSPSSPVDVNNKLECVKSKPYTGRFKVDSIYTVDEFILYYVYCIDTIDLKWGGIFWIKKNYYGIPLTIVTVDDPTASGTLIKIGDIFDLDLTPYYGAWLLREHHNYNYNREIQYDTLYKRDGSFITIPRDSIWNQLMTSPQIRGRCYYPKETIDYSASPEEKTR